jgi:uncharacterized membrane protein
MAQVHPDTTAAKGDGVRCYLAGILFPIIYLTNEPYKSNRFVRFHAFQSIVFTSIWVVLNITLTYIRPGPGWFSSLLSSLWLLFLVLWLLLMFKASRGQMFKLPLLGDLAARLAR